MRGLLLTVIVEAFMASAILCQVGRPECQKLPHDNPNPVIAEYLAQGASQVRYQLDSVATVEGQDEQMTWRDRLVWSDRPQLLFIAVAEARLAGVTHLVVKGLVVGSCFFFGGGRSGGWGILEARGARDQWNGAVASSAGGRQVVSADLAKPIAALYLSFATGYRFMPVEADDSLRVETIPAGAVPQLPDLAVRFAEPKRTADQWEVHGDILSVGSEQPIARTSLSISLGGLVLMSSIHLLH